MAQIPFAGLPLEAATHFRIYYFAAVAHLFDQLAIAFGSASAAVEQFPFLAGYQSELTGTVLEGLPAGQTDAWWRDAVSLWEVAVPDHLPLRALRTAARLDHESLMLLFTAGLLEEDVRFGAVFETVQGTPGQHRPTVALLNAWWRDASDSGEMRSRLRRLLDLGLFQALNTEAPRPEWALQVCGPVWDTLGGAPLEMPTPWTRYRPPAELPRLEDLVVPDDLYATLARLPRLLASGEASAVVIRGPRSNGRRTLLGAVARRLGLGMLEFTGPASEAERWKVVGPLATLLHALPVATLDLGPGETAPIPELDACTQPLGIALGRHGGLNGPGVKRTVSFNLSMPEVAARRQHWERALQGQRSADLEEISRRFRMTGGNIRRTADVARACAALARRPSVTLADVHQASRTLNARALDTLAAHLAPAGDWSHLSVPNATMHELADLEARCRYREALPASVGAALASSLGPGVRALFTGPSGTGKTLAARLLAASIPMDLYRIDLSAIVNKYIGETEKNLNQLFNLAEELDVMLLFDEGDALLTQRTGVQSANDRYANLETNYLLQRLDTFEGILIVTTNAPDRIDSAFRRRMDVVIDFRPPEAAERWAIWQTHLPASHVADTGLLRDIAVRCTLNGGQIRNAVLHAALLAVADGGIITTAHVEAAVHREYRKSGGLCPLRPR